MDAVSPSNNAEPRNSAANTPIPSALPGIAPVDIDLSRSQLPSVAPSTDLSTNLEQAPSTHAPQQIRENGGLQKLADGMFNLGSTIMMGGGAISVGLSALWVYFKSHAMESVWDTLHPAQAQQESQAIMLVVGGIFGISLAVGGVSMLAGKALEMTGRGMDWIKNKL